MRRMLTGFAVALIAAVVPTLALAGNQEVADQIKHKLHDSGQMSDYKIGIKYQDGTAWLFGRVANEQQMNTAIRLTFQISSVNRVVNNLTVADSEQVQSDESASTGVAPLPPGQNPLREAASDAETAQRPARPSLAKRLQSARDGAQPSYADPVPSSYTQASVRPVADEEPQPMPAYPQARPVADGARGQARMAMVQPNVRGPAAPKAPRCRCTRRPIVEQAWRRPATTSLACPTMLGQATRLIQTTPRSPIQSNIHRRPGRTSVRSIHIPRFRLDGGKSPWNGIAAGGSSTSRISRPVAGAAKIGYMATADLATQAPTRTNRRGGFALFFPHNRKNPQVRHSLTR